MEIHRHFDLNEFPIEEENTNFDEPNNLISIEDAENSISEELVGNYEPFVGQTFHTQEEAYAFYGNFARRKGFSIRKDRFVNVRGKIRRRDFFCHRAGKPLDKIIDPSKKQRNKKSSRCGCNAHIRITLRRWNEIFPEEWHVTTFISDHNHILLSPEEVRFLPTNREINEEDGKRILLLKQAGLSVRLMIRVLELEKNINHGYLPFLERDVRNYLAKVRRNIEGSDITNLFDYFNQCKQENPHFQYVFTVDDDRKLEHLFWSPAQCFEWYDKFGDVVVFDTTYKVNAYDMPCGFFVGVNNHGKTILLGCALLRNETTSTFRWLMKTFVSVMKKPPKTIVTDQDPWMTEAIAKEMPTSKHCFCIWHITTKFSSWFMSILRNKYSQWCVDFYMLYKLDTPEEFELQWPMIISKYDLGNNKHIIGLYKIKYFWVPAYLRGYFFGGMTTTGRCEYLNGFIKRFVSSNTTLEDLAKQVDIAIQEIKQTQLHDNMVAKSTITPLRIGSPLEKHACQIFTPYAFHKIQEEILRSSQYSILHVHEQEYDLRYYASTSRTQSHKVFWDKLIATCTCKKFQFSGILCRHIFRVFLQTDCHDIPSAYCPSRWCLDENSMQFEVFGEQTTIIEDVTLLENDLDNINNILCPPKSTTKGRPKKRRLKGGKEIGSQTKTCSRCKRNGHNLSTCPEIRDKVIALDYGLNPVYSVKY